MLQRASCEVRTESLNIVQTNMIHMQHSKW
jgi:hypothetical protein